MVTWIRYESATIRDAMEAIEHGAAPLAPVVDRNRRLRGVVVDGDIRRALLGSADLSDPIVSHMSTDFVAASQCDSRSAIVDLLLARNISAVPVVDNVGRLLGIHTLAGLLGSSARNVSALLVAGGRGTRLGNLTETTPKPMLRVAGRPILERLIDHIVGFGITDITVSVGHLAGIVEDHFGTGDRFGCTISFLREDPGRPRGTGGPFVDFVRMRDMQESAPILVMNGDLVTEADLGSMIDHHTDLSADATILTQEHHQEVPFGVMEIGGGRVQALTEKPIATYPVNAGAYVINAGLASLAPVDEFIAMTELLQRAIAQGFNIASFVDGRDWLDVGTPIQLKVARGQAGQKSQHQSGEISPTKS